MSLYQITSLNELPPGARKLVTVAGKAIGVFNGTGQIVAVQNICPHELAPICVGRVDGTTLESQPGQMIWGRDGEILACPWHGWEFDLLTGQCLTDRRRLRQFEVKIVDETIFIAVYS